MKTLLAHLRDIAISGFFALFPLYVLFIIITKAWTSLTSVRARISGMFGMKSILRCRRHHRVLRGPGDSHLDLEWTVSALFLYGCLEPSGRKRVVKISSPL